MNFYRSLFLLPFLAACATQSDLEVFEYTPSEILQKSSSSEWTTLASENLLYMELKNGLVVLELTPEFSPLHTKNIAKITDLKYWDDLVVMRSQDNYVAQWGDAEEKKKKFFALHKNLISLRLNPEFEKNLDFNKITFTLAEPDSYAANVGYSGHFPVGYDANKMWLLHCYGMVGVSRDEDIGSGNGSSLYAVTGHSPRHLDRNITVVGKILYGMEHLSSLPRGKGRLGFYEDSKKHHPIKWARMGNNVSKKEKLKIEVLKTSTKTYRDWIAARKARKEKWFHRPAGHIDICNASPPIKINDKL